MNNMYDYDFEDDDYSEEEESKKRRPKKKTPRENLDLPLRFIYKDKTGNVKEAGTKQAGDCRMMGTHETLEQAKKRLNW